MNAPRQELGACGKVMAPLPSSLWQPVWRVRGSRKTRRLSPDPGCALSRARTRPVRALPPNLAGGFGSRPLLGSPLPLKSAQELSGNVSNHQPTVRSVSTTLIQSNSFLTLKGARHAETVHPQILDKSSTGVANE